MGEGRNVYRVLVGKPKGNRPLGRPRFRWEDEIRLDVKKTGCGGVQLIHQTQDRVQWQDVMSGVMNLWVLAPRS
jgi:hypothetical protein